jgi:hypothetical protein
VSGVFNSDSLESELFLIFLQQLENGFNMLSTEEILLFLKTNKSDLLKRFHCSEIGLFGSFARNEQSEKSDIDILVQFEKDAPDLYNLELELKEFLKKQFNREVDVCSKKWIKPIFKPLILKEAIYA